MNGGKIQYTLPSDPRVFIHIASCALSQGGMGRAAGESSCQCLFTLGAHCVLEGAGRGLEHPEDSYHGVLPVESWPCGALWD